MRSAGVSLALLGALVGCARREAAPRAEESAPVTTPRPAAATPRAVAEAFFAELSAERYAGARAQYFSPAMSGSMSAERLEQVWRALLVRGGALVRIESVHEQPYGHFHLVFLRCAFARARYEVQITVDRQQRVAGLSYRAAQPSSRPVTPKPRSFAAPPYAKRDTFEEQAVSLGRAPWILAGTLSLPRRARPPGGFPALVLVHGSGPHDRDETIGANKPFRDLAWGLASRGVAVLRYDKRTKTYARAMAQQLATLTVKQETVEDALAAVAALRAAQAIDKRRIAVLGHSLGGILLPRIAERDRAIAGFVALAAASRPLEDLVLAQITYLAGTQKKQHPHAAHQLEKLRAKVSRVKSPTLSPETPAKLLPLGLPARYWLDLRAHPPTRLAARVRRPMLFLQGGRDYQVTREDLAGWKKALAGKRNARFVVIERANHLFIEGEGRSTPAEYRQPGHVSPRVIDEIVAFVAKLGRAR